MQKGAYVKDITANAQVDGIFVICDAKLGQARNGPFWNIGLMDCTGNIEAKIWYPLSSEFAHLEIGVFAHASGRASLYRDQLQLILDKLVILGKSGEAEIDKRLFLPASARDPEEMFQELKNLCLEEFRYPPWRKFVLAVLGDESILADFKTIPAAKYMHQAYLGGLLEHTLGVFKLCRQVADNYPELDRQTLLAGALLHDIGKIREFSGGLANDYTDDGRLLGHIILGLEIIKPFLEKSSLEEPLKQHLRHLILSHHGQYEFGSPKLPSTAEAFALHYADNLDAKLAQCRSISGETGPAEWSVYQKTLDRSIFNPPHTPQPAQAKKQKQEEKCLSLLRE